MKFDWSTVRQFLNSVVTRFRRSDPSSIRSGLALHQGSPIPKTSQEAHARLHDILEQGGTIRALNHDEFMMGWIAMAYIAPGLNPDEASIKDGGWPRGWQPIAAEAFRRFAKKELTKEELYPQALRFL